MARNSRRIGLAAVAVVCLFSAHQAMGHPGSSTGDHPLVAGAMHPLLGLDHLLAALASGLLAVRIGTRQAAWCLPAAFVGLMLAGGAGAAAGVPLPIAEWGIGLSVIVLGVMVAALPAVPLPAAAAVVGLFAACHGHAHVAEYSGGSLPAFVLGFALATLGLHAAAITVGMVAARAGRPQFVRWAGAAIAGCFLAVLIVA